MARIDYIEGIPGDEHLHRGNLVSDADFIRYGAMSRGEFRTELLRQRVKLFAEYSGDANYRKAQSLIENAAHRGIHGIGGFVGAMYHPVLQSVAFNLNENRRLIGPAAGFKYRPGIQGDDLIPVEDCEKVVLEKIYIKYANLLKHYGGVDRFKRDPINYNLRYWQNLKDKDYSHNGGKIRHFAVTEAAACERRVEVEKIYNQQLEKSAHHVPYGYLDQRYLNFLPNTVGTKSLLHNAGIGALANVESFNPADMRMWVENGILRQNAQAGAGLMNGERTSFAVADERDDAMYAAYMKWKGVKPPKIRGAHVGEPVTVTLAIIGLITLAIKAAQVIVTEVQKTKQMAFATAQGFGTDAFKSDKGDWNRAGNDGSGGSTPTEDSDNTMLIAAAGAAALLLLNDK